MAVFLHFKEIMSASEYKTIDGESFGEFRDRGSKFLAYARSIASEEDALLLVEQLKKNHPKARHWCYAWRLGTDKNLFRANDDGEPSGTAGRPILGQIDSAGLTQIVVVVVRYFGGTLLGTSGLINAYKESAKIVIDAAHIVKKIRHTLVRLRFDYTLLSDVMNAIKKLDLDVVRKDFNEIAEIELAIPQDKVEQNWTAFKAAVLKIEESRALDIKQIGGLDWQLLEK